MLMGCPKTKWRTYLRVWAKSVSATTDEGRGPVLTVGTAHQLVSYLGFRHFYRHSYSFFLEWGELEKLVTPLAEVWEQTKVNLTISGQPGQVTGEQVI